MRHAGRMCLMCRRIRSRTSDMANPRKQRGDRHLVTVRLPIELYRQIEADADRMAVPRGDVIWAVLAAKYKRRDLLPDTLKPDGERVSAA